MLPKMPRWLALVGLIIILDQLTKLWVVGRIPLGQGWYITSYFDLVHVLNRGAAFSFLANEGGWQRWFFTLLALAICTWLFVMLRQHVAERLMPTAIVLIMGGALGNVIDRFVYGAVVDFLSFHIGPYYWPAFNVADSAICVGVALMLWHQFFCGAPHERARQGG